LEIDEFWMHLTISIAKSAARQGEVPVAALLVKDRQLVTTAMNLRESLQDPTAHCEILALRRAAQLLGSWRLNDCDLYVSLEPCLMCAGALYQARIRRVIYGAHDPKGGALGTLYNIHEDQRLNHQMLVTGGILADASRALLQDFFRKKRKLMK